MAKFELDEKQSREKTAVAALGGALSGAATGATLGAAAGGIGAIPGAIIGGAIGAAGAGAAGNIADRNAQRSEYDAAAKLEAAKAKALRDANTDVQAAARSGTPARPKAASYGGSYSSAPILATTNMGTSYDAWQQTGAAY